MSEPEVIVAIYKASTHKQHVTLLELQEAALCHGWVDTQTKRRRRAVRDPVRASTTGLQLGSEEPSHGEAPARPGPGESVR